VPFVQSVKSPNRNHRGHLAGKIMYVGKNFHFNSKKQYFEQN